MRVAATTASGEASHPTTRLEPSRAATMPRTPQPHPTSRTVAPGWMSSASATVREVCVGGKTVGESRSANGPVLPVHSISRSPPGDVLMGDVVPHFGVQEPGPGGQL